jgi:hypothetical protein
MFQAVLDDGILECEECDGGELCSQQTVLLSDGNIMRHDDPPRPLVFWPGCPRQWAALWQVYDGPGGQVRPVDYVRWEYERGAHEGDLTPTGSILLRDWMRMAGLPEKVKEYRDFKEREAKRGNSR